jgi:hypothetical protein
MSNEDDKKKVKIAGAPQLTDMILGNLKPRVGKETTKWVAGLTEDAMAEAAHEARMQGVQMLTSAEQVAPKPAQVGVTHFMDYLFDCFQQYEYEFNRSTTDPDMQISVERPTPVVETIRHSLKSPETRQVFRGRISTPHWTLLLRGHNEELEGYLLPIDQLISFASDPMHFNKFLTMTGEASGEDITWTVDGVEVSWDKIRSFGKQLFALLIHVAKTGESEGVVFAFSHKEEAPSTASGAEGAAPNSAYNFNEHNPAFDDMGYTVPGASGSAKTAPAAMPAPGAMPAPEAMPARAAMPSPAATSTTASAKSSSGRIEAAFEHLQRAISDELEALTKEGQEAFGKQDMTRVEKLLQRTNAIKQIRDQLNVQIAGWKATLG